MKNYKRLTAADRGAIAILLQQHFTPAEIARETGWILTSNPTVN